MASASLESEESDESDLGEVFRIIFWCGVPATLLALGGGWWMMRRALAPVAALTRGRRSASMSTTWPTACPAPATATSWTA